MPTRLQHLAAVGLRGHARSAVASTASKPRFMLMPWSPSPIAWSRTRQFVGAASMTTLRRRLDQRREVLVASAHAARRIRQPRRAARPHRKRAVRRATSPTVLALASADDAVDQRHQRLAAEIRYAGGSGRRDARPGAPAPAVARRSACAIGDMLGPHAERLRAAAARRGPGKSARGIRLMARRAEPGRHIERSFGLS